MLQSAQPGAPTSIQHDENVTKWEVAHKTDGLAAIAITIKRAVAAKVPSRRCSKYLMQ
jgi:hypothetical protein